MSAPDDDLSALRDRAAKAGAATSSNDHLDDPTLARFRAGEEDEALDDAFRHVASCAVCRARLTEGAEAKKLVETATRPRAIDAGAPARRDGARTNRGRVVMTVGAIVLATAAAVLLWMRPSTNDAPVAVTQRWFVGTMGTSSAVLPPEDRDVELSLPDDGRDAAVLVFDDRGKRLGNPVWFERAEGRKMRAVIAPRTYAPAAKIVPLVLVGAHDDVATVIAAGAIDADRVRPLAAANRVHVETIALAP